MKNEMVIKKMSIILLIYAFTSCKSSTQIISNPIEDLPSEIITKYGIDMVPNEKNALEISQIILQERFINTEFEKLKPFKINLIAEGKVWDVTVTEKVFKNKTTIYHLRINKNTSEILNFWVDR